jgi:hypothetical protein
LKRLKKSWNLLHQVMCDANCLQILNPSLGNIIFYRDVFVLILQKKASLFMTYNFVALPTTTYFYMTLQLLFLDMSATADMVHNASFITLCIYKIVNLFKIKTYSEQVLNRFFQRLYLGTAWSMYFLYELLIEKQIVIQLTGYLGAHASL